IEWGLHICQKYNISNFDINIGALSQTIGPQLIQLNKREFCLLLGDQFGPIFYKEFQKLKKSTFAEVQRRYLNSETNEEIDDVQYPASLDTYTPSVESSSTMYSCPLEGHCPHDGHYTASLDTYTPSLDSSTTYRRPYDLQASNTSDFLSIDSYSTTHIDFQNLQSSNTYEFQLTGNLECFETEGQVLLDSYDKAWDISEESLENMDVTRINPDLNLDVFSLENKATLDSTAKLKRKTHGRYNKQKSNEEVNFSARCMEDIIRKTPGAANRDRCPKSWEFLMRLLVNTETNPSLICWEDEAHYIFRLVKPDSIIQIWNTTSENASPNKNNFARTLRYHYKTGVLIPVRAKQLVYQCGPRAIEYITNLRKAL
ncbi:unnamed protein product, partial [Meganyctiphanes norvegica]